MLAHCSCMHMCRSKHYFRCDQGALSICKHTVSECMMSTTLQAKSPKVTAPAVALHCIQYYSTRYMLKKWHNTYFVHIRPVWSGFNSRHVIRHVIPPCVHVAVSCTAESAGASAADAGNVVMSCIAVSALHSAAASYCGCCCLQLQCH
jgi:hypothetical protein